MNYSNENDLLFDDLSVLTKLTGKNNLAIIASNSDCDCSGYTSTLNIEDSDTHQIPQSISQTNR